MTKFFKTDFTAFVCDGDSIDCEVEGIAFTATLARDTDTSPRDYDAPGWCFDTTATGRHGAHSRRIIAAWDRDDWHYFGVIVTARQGDVELGEVASLWGVEGNFPGRAKNTNRHIRAIADSLLPEALDHAKARRAAIVATLAA